MKLTKEQQEAISNMLDETGFEIWNAGCTHRMSSDFDGYNVCEYGEPLHPIKQFKTVQGALNFLMRKDEE